MALVLGIVGTLLGVVAGAFLTRWIDFQYERRREVRQAIISALILREELRDAKAGVDVIIEHQGDAGAFLFDGLQAWEENREQLLSMEMAHKNWIELANIFSALLELVAILEKTRGQAWSKEAASALGRGSGLCARGIELLDPLIVEGPIPFRSPNSIFAET